MFGGSWVFQEEPDKAGPPQRQNRPVSWMPQAIEPPEGRTTRRRSCQLWRHPGTHPKATAVPHGYQPPIAPRRHLDPDVARSIADAKTRSGLSWRRLAALTGVSHPHLVLLSQGKRVPSMVTAERIIAVLPHVGGGGGGATRCGGGGPGQVTIFYGV